MMAVCKTIIYVTNTTFLPFVVCNQSYFTNFVRIYHSNCDTYKTFGKRHN